MKPSSLLQSLHSSSSTEDLSLYIHVPFCRARCHFCAFYLQIYREDKVQQYLEALRREIHLYTADAFIRGRPVTTVYFGGGTPTALTAEQLDGIVDVIKERFSVVGDAEITVEAHPDTVMEQGLHALVSAGFTRISVGVQSLDDTELMRVGRRPGLGDSLHSAIALARSAGFQNINLDLMYGLPGQTLETWRKTVDEALALAPTHLSCYALMLEEGTRFHVDVQRRDVAEPDPDVPNSMQEIAISRLAAQGYHRYEISNFSQPGYVCRHNLRYWLGKAYLGLGPSAQSYVGASRFGNVEDLQSYCQSLERGEFPVAELESLDPNRARRERVVFGLRLTHGVDVKWMDALKGDERWTSTVAQLVHQGFLSEQEGYLKLTPQGCRLADSIAVELL